MRARDGAHDEEAEAGAFDLKTGATGNAIEAFEDAFEFWRGDADAAIGDAQRDVFIVRSFDAHRDIHLVAGIFHGVIEQVGNGGAQLGGIATQQDGRSIG